MNISKKKIATFGIAWIICVLSNSLFAVDHYVTYVDAQTDYTNAIQTALCAAATGDRVILSGNIDGSERKWLTGPLHMSHFNRIDDPLTTDKDETLYFVQNGIELVLEPGVLLEAKSGAFPLDSHSVITIMKRDGIKITGYDATIRMLINEYTSGEHRMCIAARWCSNLEIKGVTLKDSGGDGIYLGVISGGQGEYNENVLIQDVVCDGNARQGISVISVKTLTIDNCTMSNTGQYNPAGLAAGGPYSGIDFEPNHADEFLQNITITNCTIENNLRYGILIVPGNLDSTSADINITITNCTVIGSVTGIWFNPNPYFVNGTINFTNCTVRDSVQNAIKIFDWSHDGIAVNMTGCTLINPAQSLDYAAIEVMTDANVTYKTGNFNFTNLYVLESLSPFVLTLEGANNDYKIEDITATIYTDVVDTAILHNDYYKNIDVKFYRPKLGFDTVFSGDIDNIGGIDSEVFFTAPAVQVYPGDYNGDGLTDLLFKGYNINGNWRGLYLARTDGSGFTRAFLDADTGYGDAANGIGGISGGPEFTDPSAKVYPGYYNNDDKMDFFVKGYGTYRALYVANSTGTGFNEVFTTDLDSQPDGTDADVFLTSSDAQVYPGDYNGDGLTDLLVKGYGTWRTLYLCRTDGTGFSRAFLDADTGYGDAANGIGGISGGSEFTDSSAQVYPGDYNGDGKTDLFVKGYGTYRALYVANSAGTGFTEVFNTNLDSQPDGTDADLFLTSSDAQVHPGDYNGDGKTDLFVKGYGTWRTLYLANSTGTGFSRAFLGNTADAGGVDSESFLTAPNAIVYTGDYNGDGQTDLFVKGVGTTRVLYLADFKDGNSFIRQFVANDPVAGGTTNVDGCLTDSSAIVYPGDYNGDGKTDLFIKGYGTYRTLYTASDTYQP